MSNKYKTIALSCDLKDNPRIFAFDYAINAICRIEKPRILEIGCARNLDLDSMGGDGWSSIYWAEYIKNCGGSLTIVDIDPQCIANARTMLSDYLDEDINFIVADGIKFLKDNYDYDWDLVYLDGGDEEWQTYEMFKLIYRPKTSVLCDDAGTNSKCDRLKIYFRDNLLININQVHKMLFYLPVYYGAKNLEIGEEKIEYNRENSNRAYRNERAIELGFSKWFANKFNNKIIEVGAVCPNYSFFRNWRVYDPYDPYSIRKNIEEIDYKNQNVLCISTIEHVGNDTGYNTEKDPQKACLAIDKIINESNNYLISFPLGDHLTLQEHVKTKYKNNYILFKRKNFFTEKNEWEKLQDQNNWDWEYLHLEKNKGYYDNAGVICIVTNQKELFC